MAVEQKLRLGLWLRYWLGLRLAPHVGTPAHVANRMLKLAAVRPSDRVVDLGCGDARLLIAAAKNYGAQGYGVELDAALYADAERAVARENLQHLITLERKDAFSVDLREATVIALYLSTNGNSRLLPMMRQQLPPGARVVSFCWPFEALEPAAVTTVDGISLYLYRFNGVRIEALFFHTRGGGNGGFGGTVIVVRTLRLRRLDRRGEYGFSFSVCLGFFLGLLGKSLRNMGEVLRNWLQRSMNFLQPREKVCKVAVKKNIFDTTAAAKSHVGDFDARC